MTPRLRGPLLMVAASAAFTTMVALIKTCRGLGFDTLELIGWRSVPAVAALFVALGLRIPRPVRPGLLAVRCMLGFGAMFCFFSATQGLGVGELSVLSRLQPVWVALFAPLAMGAEERAGPRVWAAMALGMIGTLVLAWPTLGASEIRFTSVLFGLSASVFSASAHTTLRILGRTERPATIVFWLQVAVAAIAITAILGPAEVHAPSPIHLPWLLGIGAAAMGGQLWMTRAYRIERAARVAAASYVTPLMGFAIDAVFFHTLPTLEAGIAAAFVVAAGAVLLTSEPD